MTGRTRAQPLLPVSRVRPPDSSAGTPGFLAAEFLTLLIARGFPCVAIRGRVGDRVFKTYRNKIIITRLPRFDGYEPSAAQRDRRARMRAATAFARAVYADPATKAIYVAAAQKLGRQPFRLAVSDFLHGRPRVTLKPCASGIHRSPARLSHRSLTSRRTPPGSRSAQRRMPIYLVYFFWLVAISAGVFTLERIFPGRPAQEPIREDFLQDLFWMVFNTQYVSWMLAIVTAHVAVWFNASVLYIGLPEPESLRLISHWPEWLQFIVFFLVRDFLEWNIHRAMHTVPWLWRLHELHHSCEELDWVAAFRAHWGEIIVYQTLIYLPLVVLGVGDGVIFAILVVALVFHELSHANLRWDWGPLRYFLNSPRFHAWHHAVEMHRKNGQNFGVTLVVWDWLFGTAYWPADGAAPARLGLDETAKFPRGVWRRLWHPFVRRTPLPLAREGASSRDSTANRL